MYEKLKQTSINVISIIRVWMDDMIRQLTHSNLIKGSLGKLNGSECFLKLTVRQRFFYNKFNRRLKFSLIYNVTKIQLKNSWPFILQTKIGESTLNNNSVPRTCPEGPHLPRVTRVARERTEQEVMVDR